METKSPVEGEIFKIPLFYKVLYMSGGTGFLNHQQHYDLDKVKKPKNNEKIILMVKIASWGGAVN